MLYCILQFLGECFDVNESLGFIKMPEIDITRSAKRLCGHWNTKIHAGIPVTSDFIFVGGKQVDSYEFEYVHNMLPLRFLRVQQINQICIFQYMIVVDSNRDKNDVPVKGNIPVT